MPATTIRYRQLIDLDLANTGINFAESGTLGHRVQLPMNISVLNSFFVWQRPSGSSRPVGHFLAVSSQGLSFTDALTSALGTAFVDLDGVTAGLNFSSSILDANTDANIRKNGIVSANDLLMAYVLYKCYNSSSAVTLNTVYNLTDAQDMLTNENFTSSILSSFNNEETLSNNPGDDKGAIDAMFRDLMAADPARFFSANGQQIPGLFETNADRDSSGSWMFVENDNLELRVQFKFQEAVTTRSTTDDEVSTVVIPAGSTFLIRLQLTATNTTSGAAAVQAQATAAMASALAEQANAKARAAANAQKAEQASSQAVSAAALQSANALAAYNNAVNTSAAQATAAANALASAQAAQAALAAAIASGSSEQDIQTQRAAAVAAQAASDAAKAIADNATAAIQQYQTALNVAKAALSSAQAQAAAAKAAVASTAAAAAAAALQAAQAAALPPTTSHGLTETESFALTQQTGAFTFPSANSLYNTIGGGYSIVTSTTSFADNVYIRFTIGEVGEFIAGLNSGCPTFPNYGLHFDVNNNVSYLEHDNLGNVVDGSSLNKYAIGDVYVIKAAANVVFYYKNNLLVHTTSYTDSQIFQAFFSVYSQIQILGISFGYLTLPYIGPIDVNAASDPVTQAIVAYQKETLNPQTIITSQAKANSATASRLSAQQQYNNAASAQAKALSKNKYATYALEYAISMGQTLSSIQILRASAVACRAALESANSLADSASAYLISQYNAELSAQKIAGQTALNAATLNSVTTGQTLNNTTQLLAIANNNLKLATAAFAAAQATLASSQAALASEITAGAVRQEVMARQQSVFSAQTIADAAQVKLTAATVAQEIATTNNNTAIGAKTSADVNVVSVTNNNNSIQAATEAGLAAIVAYQNNIIQQANVNAAAQAFYDTQIKKNAAELAYNSATAAYTNAQAVLNTAVSGGATLPQVTSLQQAASAAAAAQQTAYGVYVAANDAYNIASVGVTQSADVSGILLALADLVLKNTSDSLTNTLAINLNNAMEKQLSARAELQKAQANYNNAASALANAVSAPSQGGGMQDLVTSRYLQNNVIQMAQILSSAREAADYADAAVATARQNVNSNTTVGAQEILDAAAGFHQNQTNAAVVNFLVQQSNRKYAEFVSANATFVESQLLYQKAASALQTATASGLHPSQIAQLQAKLVIASQAQSKAQVAVTAALYAWNDASSQAAADVDAVAVLNAGGVVQYEQDLNASVNGLTIAVQKAQQHAGNATSAVAAAQAAWNVANSALIVATTQGEVLSQIKVLRERLQTASAILAEATTDMDYADISLNVAMEALNAANQEHLSTPVQPISGGTSMEITGSISLTQAISNINTSQAAIAASVAYQSTSIAAAKANVLTNQLMRVQFAYNQAKDALETARNIYNSDLSILNSSLGIQKNGFFQPTDLPGCTLWLDASGASNYSVNPSHPTLVSTWFDKSELSNNATAVGSVLVGNGLMVIGAAPGTSGFDLPDTSFPFGLDSQTELTWFVCMGYTQNSSASPQVLISQGSGANVLQLSAVNPTTSSPSAYDFNTAGLGVAAYNPDQDPSTLNQRGTWGQVVTSKRDQFYNYIYVNGENTQVSGPSVTPVAGTVTIPNNLNKIGYDNRGMQLVQGNISEIICFNRALNDSERQLVEAYLSWKWLSNGSVLPTSSPFNSPLVNPLFYKPTFTPNQLVGCDLWLDASDLTGRGSSVASGTIVSSWVDKTGSGHSAITTAVGTTTTVIQNSRTLLSFNGGNFACPYYQFPNTEYSIVTVQALNVGESTTQATVLADYRVFTGAMTGNVAFGSGKGTVWKSLTSQNISASQLRICITTYGKDLSGNKSTFLYPFIDGTPQFQQVGLTGPYSGNLYIGGKGDMTWNGKIAEVIIYSSSLTQNAREMLEGYLALKWGLQANLPASHPYKAATSIEPINNGLIIDQIKTLRLKAERNAASLATALTNFKNSQLAFSYAQGVAVQDPQVQYILEAQAKAQASSTAAANAKSLIASLQNAKKLLFQYSGDAASAQSSYIVASAALETAVAAGRLMTEIADLQTATQAAGRAYAEATALLNNQMNIVANLSVQVNVDPVAHGVTDSTAENIKVQNKRVESYQLYKVLSTAQGNFNTVQTLFDNYSEANVIAKNALNNSIAQGSDISTIQGLRLISVGAASTLAYEQIQLNYATTSLNLALANAEVDPIAQSFVTTAQLVTKNATAAGYLNTVISKVHIDQADVSGALLQLSINNENLSTSQGNLYAAIDKGLTVQEIQNLQEAFKYSSLQVVSAQNDLTKKQAILDADLVLKTGAQENVSTTQGLVDSNNVSNILLLNGFQYISPSGPWILDPALVPSGVIGGVPFALETISILPLGDNRVYSPTAYYSIGDLACYPTLSDAQFMCLVGPA
jgi:hypothetical protein